MDLGDYLYNRWGGKKPHWEMSRIEKDYFKVLNENMIAKSKNRVDIIKKRLQNDVNKNTFDKKYQIKSLHEYNILKEFCKTLNTKGYEVLWHCDMNGLKMNKLERIIEGDYSCCRDCDRPMIFTEKKVYVIYLYFSKI
jgi:hypothetical protein